MAVAVAGTEAACQVAATATAAAASQVEAEEVRATTGIQEATVEETEAAWKGTAAAQIPTCRTPPARHPALSRGCGWCILTGAESRRRRL